MSPEAKINAEAEDSSPTQASAKEEASGQLTKAPELLNFVDAEYPESAKTDKVEAAVVMLLTLDDKGKVTEVSIQESSKSPHAFDEAASKLLYSSLLVRGN